MTSNFLTQEGFQKLQEELEHLREISKEAGLSDQHEEEIIAAAEDASGQDQATVLAQRWVAPFQIQHHLSQGEGAVWPHVAAGLIPL